MILDLALAASIVVIPPGTYSTPIDVPRGVTVMAEGVTFDGSRSARAHGDGTWRWVKYTPIPRTDGHGMRTKSHLPDQAWVGQRELRQVTRWRDMARGRFLVRDGRLWVHRDDARGLRVSRLRTFPPVKGVLIGATIKGFSPTPADGAAVRVSGTLRDVTIADISNVAVQVAKTGATLDRVTINRSGWMGISAYKCKNLRIIGGTITRINHWSEWPAAPQSGAIKTSRCIGVSMTGTKVTRVNGHGLWFDQSTVGVRLHKVSVSRVSGRALFYEISHQLRATASQFSSRRESRFVGASDVRVLNSSFVPRYLVLRDRRTCPDPRTSLCPGAMSSDRLDKSVWDRLTPAQRPTWVNRVSVAQNAEE